MAKVPKSPLTDKMRNAAKMAGEGKSYAEISTALNISKGSLSRWFGRTDMRELRSAAMSDYVGRIAPKAYATLEAQLASDNPWVAQGAAREIIRLYNQISGAADQSVLVSFAALPQVGAPKSAETIEGEIVDDA